jgi:hypothetical protein
MMDRTKHENHLRLSCEMNAESWAEHEHLSAPLEFDALRLLADAGTPELAKFAIDSVEKQHNDQARTQFAQSLGFESYGELLAASAAIDTNDTKLWFVTLLSDGQWVAWNFVEFRPDVRHPTREDAVVYVERSASVIDS